MSDPARAKEGPVLGTDGVGFTLDGEPIDLWGVRTASATASDEQCDHLIDQLDAYRNHGVNAVTVFYMGCRGANYDPFEPDGSSIDPEHQQRMERIITACAERDMVVIVGVFYQHAPFGLTNTDAVERTVRSVAEQLQAFGNVIINVANEHNSHGYDGIADIYDLQNPQRIIDLCRAVHGEDPDRLVGGGGYSPTTNLPIGRADEVDILLFDTGGSQLNSAALYDRYRRGGVRETPMVNVETFGGWTKRFPRGVFPGHVKDLYHAEIDRAAERDGLSVFFHNSPWCQDPDRPMRYDLGGDGTEADPGIRWYFEHVNRVISS